MCCFYASFGAVAHTTHTTFAFKRPKRSVVNFHDGFDRTIFYTYIAMVTIARRVKSLGKQETACKIIPNRYRGNNDVDYNFRPGNMNLLTREYFFTKTDDFCLLLFMKFFDGSCV